MKHEVPEILRSAPLPAGLVFWFWGRPLSVVRVVGDDPAAPVIVEELQDSEFALSGQYALWSLDCVQRVLRRNSSAIRQAAGLERTPDGNVVPMRPRSRQRM